jgi:Tol biopolymer transport system component
MTFITRPQASILHTRYWLAIGVFALLLLLLAALIVAAGSRAQVRIESITPTNDQLISTRPVWRISFAQAIAPASVQGTLHLFPTVPLTARWVEDTLEIRPQRALAPGQPYTLTIGTGLQTTNGVALQGSPSWSYTTRPPRIAYVMPTTAGPGELWLSDIEGSARRLSAAGQAVRDFDVLPDGSAILYTVTEAENTESLWRVDTEIGEIRRLTEGVGVVHESPRLHPLGDTLAVQIRRESQIADTGTRLGIPRLYLMDANDGSEIALLYGDGPYVANLPRWSPDGSQLAFYDTELGAIVLTDLAAPPTFFQAAGAFLWEQSWSPDGVFLTYTLPDPLDSTSPENMVVRDLLNSNETILTTPNLAPRAPAFSPDGTQLAFSFDSLGAGERQGGIGLIRTNGTGQRILINEANVTYSQPLWSPDGAWLLYGRFSRAEGQTTQGLWLMRRDGTEIREIASVGLRAKWLP